MSVGVAFAASADDVVVSEMNDEISINESMGAAEDESDMLEISEDATIKEDVQTVTENTFFNYFDKTGSMLLDAGNGLIFEGDFSDIGISTITIDKPAIFAGNGAVFKDVTFVINSDNVFIDGFTITQNNGVKAFSIESTSAVCLSNNIINYSAKSGQDGYAIFANQTNTLILMNNVINYVGNTMGDNINNAVYMTECDDVIIFGNEFNLSLVSPYVPWSESPSGSGNWVSLPVSEGIVVESSDGVYFLNNTVYVSYNNVVGSYDTIYSITFKNSNNTMIVGNNITSLGHTYVYGVTISGDNFNISRNNITTVSDSYYANSIDIECSVNGVVENNYLRAKSPVSAYIIYLGADNSNSHVNYIGNAIIGDAYNVFGLSLGDGEDNSIEDNFIILSGNYTTGIAYRGSNLNVKNNLIYVNGTNVGDMSIWESFSVRTIGISIKSGNGSISDNSIESSGDYVIDLGNNNVTLNGNSLSSEHKKGYYAVLSNGLSVGRYFYPKETNIALNKDNDDVVITLTSNGVPISDAKLIYTVNGGIPQYGITDDEGKIHVHDLIGNVDVDVYFLGKNDYGKSSAKVSFINLKRYPNLNVTYYQDSASSLKLRITANEKFNDKVTIKISQKIYTLRLSNGIGELSVKDLSKGTYTLLATCDVNDEFYSGEFTTAVTVGSFNDITVKIVPINSKTDYASGYFSFKAVDQNTNNPIANKNFSVAVKGSDGDSMYWIIKQGISYKIGVSYNFTSDENGVVSIENANFYPGLLFSDYVYAPVGNYVLHVTGFDNIVCNAAMPITINKANININIDPYEEYYGSDKPVVIAVTNAKTGEAMKGITLHLYMPDTVAKDYYFVTGENGICRINVSGLVAGNYKLTVSNNDTNNMELNSVEGLIKILPQSVEVLEFDYGESGSITVDFDQVNLADIYVVDHPEAKINLDGKVITVSGLNAGEYALIIKGSKNNNQKTLTVLITVNKANPNLNVTYYQVSASSLKLRITANENFNDKVTIKISQKIYMLGLSNGIGELSVKDLSKGKYTLLATCDENDDFYSGEFTTAVKVGSFNDDELDDELDDESDYYLFVPDIEFNYGETGLVEIEVDGGGIFIDAEILDCDSYNMKHNQNKISISNLDAGEYTLSVTYGFGEDYGYEITKTSTITVNEVAARVSFDDVSFDYGKSGSTTVALDGASSFSARVSNHPEAVISINDDVVTISGLNAGSYTLIVTSVPDSNHNPYTKSATIWVNKVDSSVSLNDISFNYGGSGSAVATTYGATGVSASIAGYPNAVSVNGNSITVSGLNVGTYTLTVKTIPDSNHNEKTTTAKVTVNKLDSTVSLNDISFNYGGSGSATATISGASGVTASIAGYPNAVSVNGNRITVSGLNVGTYTLTVKTIPYANYNEKTTTAKVTVKKVDSTVSVNGFSFNYGTSGSVTATTTGASGVTASITGNPNAVSVNGNRISVSGLNAGTYTLNVKTVPDANHNEKTTTAIVTVNKVDSTVSLNDFSFNYGSSGFATAITTGATGVVASIVGYPNAVGVGGNDISVSGLNAGTYTLNVKTVPDVNHNEKSVSVTVKVNKKTAKIKASSLTTAYKKGKFYTITLTDEYGNGISNVALNIKVDGKSKGTIKTGSGGKATFKTSSLSAGSHKIKISVNNANYNCKSVSSTIKITKPTALIYIPTKESKDNGGQTVVFTIKIASNKKNIKEGVQFIVTLKKGSKVVKTYKRSSVLTKSGYVAVGFGTNAYPKGTYTVQISPVDTSKYSGTSKPVKLVITKKGKWTTK